MEIEELCKKIMDENISQAKREKYLKELLQKVKENGDALGYVPKEVQVELPKICLEAVKQNALMLEQSISESLCKL